MFRDLGKRLFPFALASLSAAAPTMAQDIEQSLKNFLDDTGADVVCALSDAHDYERATRNAIVWPGTADSLKALVFRVDMPSTTAAAPPCWTGPGRCAIFEGNIAAPAAACTSKRGFRNRLYTEVYGLHDRAAANSALMDFADNIIRLVDGVQPEDSFVAFLDDFSVYMSDTPSGARRVRIDHTDGEITIARLRIALVDIDMRQLTQAADRLGTRRFALLGPAGALSTDHRIFLDGVCMKVLSPGAMRERLTAANDVLDLDIIPKPGDPTEAAFEDLVQMLLGGSIVHGRQIDFRIDQDPRLFLLIRGQTNLCP